jgi:hypothetical protein
VPETVALGDHGTTTRNRVSVLTSAGLQQFMLEEADALSFVDAELPGRGGKSVERHGTSTTPISVHAIAAKSHGSRDASLQAASPVPAGSR